ncbi:Fes1p [Sugiyamaella lignohabitans]|uniref:Hsp70 nucleotide exchange factor FES1 n=1 Tax=Sugiyamaella lignohabitans TaxID=796027 RepID=A0A167F1X9_9ASCO|nr:Fes1p [Sugiyamaella lignohabitans]ANB14721.1 Fes1p [Sugiyamaella lignohabitans]
MEKLLKWSIESASYDPNSGKEAPAKPDPELLAQLFGAKDEPTLMKEAIQVAINKENSLEDRETALDNFEMLIENLDNANNIENIGLWPPILQLVADSEPTIRKMACWIIGTATQNNPKTQEAFVAKDGSLKQLLDLVTVSSPAGEELEVVYKAIYALSSVLGHCPQAYEKFEQADGWSILAKLLSEENHNSKLQFRSLSLVHSVSHIEPVGDKFVQLRKTGTITSLIEILKQSTQNVQSQEKVLHILGTLQTASFDFTPEEKSQIVAVRKSLIASEVIQPDEYHFSA